MYYVSPLGSLSLAATFLVDVNLPGYQEDLISSLVGDAISGAMLALRLLALAARLPASLPLVGGGLVCNRLTLLWYSLNPLFCEWAKLCLRVFCGKILSLFFSLSGYPTVWVAISH